MALLKTSLIGAGVFGGYHAGKIAASEHTEFTGIHDADFARAQALAEKHKTEAMLDLETMLTASDAVIIASPAVFHEELVEKALSNNCHILVEKPMALHAGKAYQFCEFARSQNLVLQGGHQERFVFDALGLFNIAEKPRCLEAIREGPLSNRTLDVSVIYDLMTHDIDLMLKLFGEMPASPEVKHKRLNDTRIDEAELDFSFSNDRRATLRAGRLADGPKRSMKLVYDKGEVFIDFVTRKVRNSTSYELNEDLAAAMPDPLGAADEAFFRAASGLAPLILSAEAAAQTVDVAEKCERACNAS